jgi:hypothetical protein
MEYTGLIGPYLYKTEYLFCAMMWLHPVLFYYVKFGGINNIDRAIKDKAFICIFTGIILLVALIFFISPLGMMFGIVENPIMYFVLSFMPVCAFALTLAITNAIISK